MSVYNRKSWFYGGRKHWIHNGRHYSSRIKRKKRFKTMKYVGKMKKNGFWIFNNFESNGIRFKTKSWYDFDNESYKNEIKNNFEKSDDEILSKIYEDDEEFERQIYIDSQIYDLDGY